MLCTDHIKAEGYKLMVIHYIQQKGVGIYMVFKILGKALAV